MVEARHIGNEVGSVGEESATKIVQLRWKFQSWKTSTGKYAYLSQGTKPELASAKFVIAAPVPVIPIDGHS